MSLSVATFIHTRTVRFQNVESTAIKKGMALEPTNPYARFSRTEWFLSGGVQEGGRECDPTLCPPGMMCMPFDNWFWFLFK